MSNIKRAIEARDNFRTGKNIPKKRRKKDVQIEGQISFYAEGTELIIDDSFEREAAEKHKAAVIEYYRQFSALLNRYGDHKKYYALVQAFDSGHPGQDAVNTVNYHYGGDVENVRIRLDNASRWLNVALKRTKEAALAAGLTGVDFSFDIAYHNSERRQKFRSILKRESGRWAAGRTTLIYSPEDLENEYQHWRVTRTTKKAPK